MEFDRIALMDNYYEYSKKHIHQLYYHLDTGEYSFFYKGKSRILSEHEVKLYLSGNFYFEKE